MATTAIGQCDVAFGVCGCMDVGEVCLQAVHHFNAAHTHYGYPPFDCTAWPPDAPWSTSENSLCSDDGYGVDANSRYLRITVDYEWTVTGGPGWPSAHFRERTVTTVNRYTGMESNPVYTLTIFSGSPSDVSQMVNGYWNTTSTDYGACSGTSFVYTTSGTDVYGTGTTFSKVHTTTMDQPVTAADFLADCATLYAARTLDDLDADYEANGARISNAAFSSSGVVQLTYGDGWGLPTAGVSAHNYAFDNSVNNPTNPGVRIAWSGRKCLALAVACVSNPKTVLQRRQVDACSGVWTDNGTTAVPVMAEGDTLGLDEILQFRLSDSDWG